MVNVAVYAEGRTEWYVARKLWKMGILRGMEFADYKRPTKGLIMEGGLGVFLKRLDPRDQTSILIDPPSSDKILVMFDQEQLRKDHIVSEIEARLRELEIISKFYQCDGFPNVLAWEVQLESGMIPVVVHVADHTGKANKEGPDPDANKDFDGYIVELLQNLEKDPRGVSIVQRMLKERHQEKAKVVHQIGNQKIPDLMKDDQWPIKRSKTILYSHITAMQIGKSHTIFSEKVVEKSDKKYLYDTFKSLIAAWDALKKEDGT